MGWHHIASLAETSGGILYLMPALLLIGLTIALERTFYLELRIAAGKRLIARLDALEHLGKQSLLEVSRQFSAAPFGPVLRTAAQILSTHSVTPALLERRLDDIFMRQVPSTDRRLWVLDTLVTLAPLLGLLGTIIGIFSAFSVLSQPGKMPTQITGGIAEALIATAAGLVVAMVGLVFYNRLNERVRQLAHMLETTKMVIVNRAFEGNLASSGSRPTSPKSFSVPTTHAEEKQEASL